MRKLILFSLLLPLCVALVACGDNPSSRLRVVHLSPDAPNVDVLVNGSKIISNVAYKNGSDYLKLSSGSTRLQVRPTGSSTDVIDTTANLASKQDYTAMAVGLAGSINPLLLTDDNSAPTSGNVKLRVVHAAPSAPAVDVYLTAPGADLNSATPQLTNVPFKGFSGYLQVPAGPYQARVTLAGTKTVAIDSGSLNFEAGQVRTVIAVDEAGGGPPFGLLVLRDLN